MGQIRKSPHDEGQTCTMYIQKVAMKMIPKFLLNISMYYIINSTFPMIPSCHFFKKAQKDFFLGFLIKFRYSEKATKIWPIFHFWFDINQMISGKWDKFLWPFKNIWTVIDNQKNRFWVIPTVHHCMFAVNKRVFAHEYTVSRAEPDGNWQDKPFSFVHLHTHTHSTDI